ncbi:PRC-barrel domain-containing protein [Thiosocius teredinicola]|uniref:PRC-barrel domain-containing protein n=1 Tax=Thiosocius teredinicola TaxID=1973002 RepID=UPI0009914679
MNISARAFIGGYVKNLEGENLGNVEEVMIDTDTGLVSYALLDMSQFLGVSEKLFPVPWNAFHLDGESNGLLLDIDRARLTLAEGFEKDDWPDFTDRDYEMKIYDTYRTRPYWQ